MKGANTVFVQDRQSNAILYTRADILRREEANEVKQFVAFGKKTQREIYHPSQTLRQSGREHAAAS